MIYAESSSLDSAVTLGDATFPPRGTLGKQALYQGMASAVPNQRN
jgi:hypothetical protein